VQKTARGCGDCPQAMQLVVLPAYNNRRIA
jgi:hypothetical protein